MTDYVKKQVEFRQSKYIRNSTVLIYREDKQKIDQSEIIDLYNDLKAKIHKDSKIRIRCLGIKSWMTFHEDEFGDLNIKDIEKYFKDGVKENTKFNKFFSIELNVIQPVIKK